MIVQKSVRTFPSIKKISGHNEYAARDCPCFDVRHEVELGLLGVHDTEWMQ